MPQSEHIAIQPFMEYLRFEKRYSKHTLVAYQTDLEQFFSFLRSQYETELPEQVSTAMVRSWLAEIREEGVEARSINRKISALKSFYKFRMKKGWQAQSPLTAISTPRAAKRLPVYIEQAHMDTLLRHVAFPDTWQGRTEKLVLTVFYATGMRLSELVQLKISQLDFAQKQVKVFGKGSKERILPLSAEILAEIKDYLSAAPDREAGVETVFISEKGKPLQHRAVYEFVRRYLSLVTTVQKKSPHILRHSFATHLMNNGADLNAVKELLGHSSLAATQVYTHNTIDQLKEVFRKAHPKA